MAASASHGPVDSILLYKTQPCPCASCPQPSDCWYFHTSSDHRRPPVVPGKGQFLYQAQLCPKEGDCEDERCEYANNDLELAFHPLKFKVRMCEERLCRRKYCPYAHETAELRNTIGQVKQEIPLLKVFPAHQTPASALTLPQLMLFYQEKGSLQQALSHTLSQLSAATTRLACSQCRKTTAEGIKTCCGFRQCLACWQAETEACVLCGKAERQYVLLKPKALC